MSVFDINDICWELLSTMEHNFEGTAEERFYQAVELLKQDLHSVCLTNKDELINELKLKGII